MFGERHDIDLSLAVGLEQFRLDLHTSWWSRLRRRGHMLPQDAADASYEWVRTLWTVLGELPSSNLKCMHFCMTLGKSCKNVYVFDAQHVCKILLTCIQIENFINRECIRADLKCRKALDRWTSLVVPGADKYLPFDRTVYIVCGVGKQMNYHSVCRILADLRDEGLVAAWWSHNRYDKGCIAVRLTE